MTAGPAEERASGAWLPGDAAGDRRFLSFGDRGFALEGGGVLRDVAVAYETWGTLNDDASNAVLVCHALTGDSHAVGPLLPGHPQAGWWDNLIGPGKGIDTDRWFVVCANVLGGCQGSTGPASAHPDDGKPWGSRFPVVSGEGDGPEDLIGYLHIKDVLEPDEERRQRPVADRWIRPFATVTSETPLHEALEVLQRRGAHMARVVTPEGAALGVAALEDVIEELVGEIRDAAHFDDQVTAHDRAGNSCVEGG